MEYDTPAYFRPRDALADALRVNCHSTASTPHRPHPSASTAPRPSPRFATPSKSPSASPLPTSQIARHLWPTPQVRATSINVNSCHARCPRRLASRPSLGTAPCWRRTLLYLVQHLPFSYISFYTLFLLDSALLLFSFPLAALPSNIERRRVGLLPAYTHTLSLFLSLSLSPLPTRVVYLSNI